MPGAVIVIDQLTGAGLGTPGVARDDLWALQQVTLGVGTVGNSSYQWDLLSTPTGSAAIMDAPTSAVCHFTPDLRGTYRIRLLTNGGGPGNVQILVVRVRYDNAGVLLERGWAYPAVGEQTGENNFPGNDRSWAEIIEYILEDTRIDLVAINQTLSNPIEVNAVKIQSNAVKVGVPTNGDTLVWSTVNNRWESAQPALGVARHTYQLLAGDVATNLISSSPEIVGSTYFDPNSIIPTTSGKTRTVTFRVLIETTNAAFTGSLQLYDKDGITGSVGLIASSLIADKPDTTSACYQADVSVALGATTTAGILECWLWMGTTSPLERVTCSMARIDVGWS